MDRISQLRALLVDNPGDSFLKHALALEFVKLGDDEQAGKLFEEVLVKNENYIGSYFHLCQVLIRKGNIDEAITWFKKGLDKAREAGDNHAYSELLSAYEDLIY